MRDSTWNLLRSDGGINLSPEICLRIAESVLEAEARDVKALSLLSKSFRCLMKCYETSIARSISDRCTEMEYTNQTQSCVVSRCVSTVDRLVSIHTYPWLDEMQCRGMMVDFLVDHEVTEMMDSTNCWPTMDVPKPELQQRLLTFKRNAFLLLYRLADCTAGLKTTQKKRIQQAEYMHSLSPTQLASLGIMVEVMGQNFYTITKNSILDCGLADALNLATSPSSESQIDPSAPIADLLNNNWLRECMCVFEDLIQRYGPTFAWAYFAGSTDSAVRPDMWARAELQKGLDNMNAFELGYTMSYASLQSVVWKVFCKNAGCSLRDSWNTAKELVETELKKYKIDV